MSEPSFVLRLAREGQSPVELEFSQELVTIGREAGDVVLDNPGASSRHAEIRFTDGKVHLRDVGSTNGTWVGTRKVTSEAMTPGVRFTMGTGTLELVAIKGLEPEPVATMVMPAPHGPAGTEVRPRSPQPAVAGESPLQKGMAALRGAGESFQKMPAAQRQKLLIGAGAAVLLLGGFLLFRGGDGSGPNTRPLTATKEATVKAVWFRGPLGPQASGGTSPSTVRIAPNSKDGASVGVLEEFAGGAGNQWRTATWLAAFSASQLTGQNLTDYEFLVRTGGHIDGPSAGMLMTATMLSILRGKPVLPNTTMTGTINPDGSAGPVGGIVQKMEGASKDGIKRFGFPMGARNHQDLRNGRIVDLFEVGKEFGLEVREIHDVFEAYEFLTGDTLARPEAISETEMELDAETAERLRNKSAKWTARVQGEIAGIGAAAKGLEEKLRQRLQPFASQADAAYQKAQRFEQSDFLACAFESYVQAAVYATLTKDVARFLGSLAKNDRDGMIAQIREGAAVKGVLSSLLGEAELAAKRKTGGGQINTLRSYQSAVIADSFTSMADNAVDNADRILQLEKEGKAEQKQKDALPDLMLNAVIYYSIAKTMLDAAQDQKDFGNEEGQSTPIGVDVIGRYAAAYGSAAGAVLQYLESLTIDDAAREAGIDKDTARNRLASNDDDYLLATRAVSIAEGVQGSKAETNVLRLAAGSMAFLKGASLVNKYYSLGGSRDQSGELLLSNRKALSAQLDLARQLAREAAGKAKAAGCVPIAARIAYQLGVAKREGNDEDKLAALEAFWESAFWSELAANAAIRR